MRKPDNHIIFLHIPKTGGSTLQGIINRNYSSARVVNIHNQRAADEYVATFGGNTFPDVIKGHFSFGIHAVYGDHSFRYLCMIRNPVDRLASLYYFLRTREKHPLYKPLMENNYSLAAFVESGIYTLAENGQTKMIAGIKNKSAQQCNDEIFAQATANIEKHFSVVGTCERFDESLLLMAHLHNWKRRFYRKANVNRQRASINEMDDHTRNVLEENTQWDKKLYEYCNQRLNAQLQLHPEIKNEMATFVSRNRKVGRIVDLLRPKK